MAAASASLPASSTATADIGRATLQTILDCGDAGYCRNVPRPTVRGSTQLLLTLVVPIITTAFKTLYMHCSRKWWKRALDFAARLLFPEYGLLRVQREEVDRTHFIKVLHDMGFNFATRQQLMAIQEGKLHLSRSSDSSSYSALSGRHSRFSTGASLSPSHNSDPTKVETSGPSAQLLRGAITWCSESPSQERGCIQLDIKDVHAYKDILQYLPTGRKTIKGIGLPDSATFILVLQLVWLLVTVALRLAHKYTPALVELYGLYALTAFVVERVITLFNAPAWEQHVVFTTPTPYVDCADNGERRTWKKILVIIPIILTAAWPIYMFVYGRYGGGKSGSLSYASTICMAAGGSYCSGCLWYLFYTRMSESKRAIWRALRFFPLSVSCLAFVVSKALIVGLGVHQVYIGEREIFLTPARDWDIPHLTG